MVINTSVESSPIDYFQPFRKYDRFNVIVKDKTAFPYDLNLF